MTAVHQPEQPAALTIAGSDSGGGAGIQADLKTFAALGVYGTSAITAVTAQNPRGVVAVHGLEPELVAAQIRAVRAYFPLAAAKIGMLHSVGIVEAVAAALAERPAGAAEPPPLVVDPVLVATSGTRLLREDALQALQRLILPRAALITPNVLEAAVLGAEPLSGPEALEPAARALHRRYGVPVLVKGGHVPALGQATDCLFDGRRATCYRHRWIGDVNTHGTGCTLSAAITAYLALGRALEEAVRSAIEYLQLTIEQAMRPGPEALLNQSVRLE